MKIEITIKDERVKAQPEQQVPQWSSYWSFGDEQTRPVPSSRVSDPNYSACSYLRLGNGDQVMLCARCSQLLEPNGEPYKTTVAFLIELGKRPIHLRCQHKRGRL